MDLIEIDISNRDKALNYLASVGKAQEFNDKGIDPHQWAAPILFANQIIIQQNQNTES